MGVSGVGVLRNSGLSGCGGFGGLFGGVLVVDCCADDCTIMLRILGVFRRGVVRIGFWGLVSLLGMLLRLALWLLQYRSCALSRCWWVA